MMSENIDWGLIEALLLDVKSDFLLATKEF